MNYHEEMDRLERLCAEKAAAHRRKRAGSRVLQFPAERVLRDKRQQEEATEALRAIERHYPGISNREAWIRVRQTERIVSDVRERLNHTRSDP